MYMNLCAKAVHGPFPPEFPLGRKLLWRQSVLLLLAGLLHVYVGGRDDRVQRLEVVYISRSTSRKAMGGKSTLVIDVRAYAYACDCHMHSGNSSSSTPLVQALCAMYNSILTALNKHTSSSRPHWQRSHP